MTPNVQPGSKWRDPSAQGGPIVITVDEIDGETVIGTSATENVPTTAVWVGRLSEFESFEPLA